MSLNDKAAAALKRELVRAFPERAADDAGHDRLAEALSKPASGRKSVELNVASYEQDDAGCVRLTVNTNVRWKQPKPLRLNNGAERLACLIDSAPELLEACKNIVQACELTDDAYYDAIDTAINIARAAIAKAEGGAK